MSSEKKTHCNACGKPITTLIYMDCAHCKELYDLECLNITTENYGKFTESYKENWMCPTCTCAKPKTGDTSTPIRLLNSTFTNINKTRGARNKQVIDKTCDDEELSLLTVIQEIQLLRQDVQALTHKFQDYDKKLELRDREVKDLRATVCDLQQKVDAQAQNNLRNEMDIIGIPEESNENLAHIVMVASNKLGVNLQEGDIDDVCRAGPKRPNTPSSNDLRSRPIVVKFLRRIKRDEVLAAAKVRRNMTSEHVAKGPIANIYFNERLTATNRQLFRESKSRAKLHKFAFCWIRNGNIYVRKAPNTKENKYPAIHIRSSDDIDIRIGLAPPLPTSAGCDPSVGRTTTAM